MVTFFGLLRLFVSDLLHGFHGLGVGQEFHHRRILHQLLQQFSLVSSCGVNQFQINFKSFPVKNVSHLLIAGREVRLGSCNAREYNYANDMQMKSN